MGKYTSVVIGAVVAILGAAGLIRWWVDFAVILKGTIPVIFIFGGVVAVIAGISEIKDETASKKEEEKK